ncbi:LysR family transcriptional regulator [Roseomonas stagni]|uniref:LysR family transcriptional regulator n=1 Tax=Falsiroseomonas algicola TaxID=2716930 RepID=A0A6M1LQ38_9PROT|nr:LysR substrate-binding domain-containing protein [Falsiroseomonas algicola]NGM22511.1 LysR family transcriptional regulator [Falsiroseomonas algicola]
MPDPDHWRPDSGAAAMRHMRIWTYLLAIQHTGSIRQAAERLNIAPSALQRRLRDVEQDLGFDLFERSASGVRPSAAGEIFLGWVRRQCADLDRSRQQMEALRGLRRGHVRVAASQAVASDLLPRQIAAFQARYPLISFECPLVGHDAAAERLVDGSADLVLAFGLAPRPEVLPLLSIGQRLCAVMAAGHALAGRKALRLRDCAAHPLALPTVDYGARRILDEWAARRGMALDLTLESDSFDLLRQYVRNAQAVTFQIEIGALPAGASDGLVAIPVDDRDLAHGPLVLAQRRGRALPVAAAAFAEHLARALDAQRTTPMLEGAPP